MTTISYTPSVIAGTFATLADIRAVYATNGVRTGFGFYTNGTTPAYFTTNNAFMNALADEGFFTGSNPKVFYTPEQTATLLTKLFTLGGSSMYGVEYKMRTEGFTVGDFMQGMVQHSPGDAAGIILSNMNAEGYVTGLQGILSPADAALFDNDCIDGRCIGSGCMAPTVHHLGQLTAGSSVGAGSESPPASGWQAAATDSVSLNLPYNAQALIFLSAKWGRDHEGGGEMDLGMRVTVSLDGSELGVPYLQAGVNKDGISGVDGWGAGYGANYHNTVGFAALSAGVNHTILLTAKATYSVGNINYWLVDCWVMLLKQSC